MSLSLCPLLPPGSSPRSFCVAGVVVCFFCFGLSPLCWFPSPHDGRVLFGGFCVFLLTCCLDTEVTALHHCSVISPHNIGLCFSSYEFVCGGADFCLRPPSPFYLVFVLFLSLGCLIHVAFLVGCLGRALLTLFCFCVFSGKGGRSPVEPWTRLHCSELYWRCPVVLPAVQSGAPSCSKACQHGSVR